MSKEQKITKQEVEIIFSYKRMNLNHELSKDEALKELNEFRREPDVTTVEILSIKDHAFEIKVSTHISCYFDFDKISKKLSDQLFGVVFTHPENWWRYDIKIESIREEKELYNIEEPENTTEMDHVTYYLFGKEASDFYNENGVLALIDKIGAFSMLPHAFNAESDPTGDSLLCAADGWDGWTDMAKEDYEELSAAIEASQKPKLPERIITIVVEAPENVTDQDIIRKLNHAIEYTDGFDECGKITCLSNFERELVETVNSLTEELSTWVTENADEHDHSQISINETYNNAKEVIERYHNR